MERSQRQTDTEERGEVTTLHTLAWGSLKRIRLNTLSFSQSSKPSLTRIRPQPLSSSHNSESHCPGGNKNHRSTRHYKLHGTLQSSQNTTALAEPQRPYITLELSSQAKASAEPGYQKDPRKRGSHLTV